MTRSTTKAREPKIGRRALRTPRSAAFAGIAFSILFTIALVAVHVATPDEHGQPGGWLSDGTNRDTVLAGLAVVPFAGIAFLWFIGVVRDRIGEVEDRFFATVFLGSGLLFVAMLFASTAVAAGMVSSVGEDAPNVLTSDVWGVGRQIVFELMAAALRMAAVFMIASSTILLRTGTGPRWLTGTGYAVAVFLVVAVGYFPWIELFFPVWVLVLSLWIFFTDSIAGSGRRRADIAGLQ